MHQAADPMIAGTTSSPIDEQPLADRNVAEAGVDDRIIDVLRSFVRSSWKIGRHPGDQLDAAARAFCSRVVRRAIAAPRPITDLDLLRTALQEKSPMPFAGAPAALAAKTVLTRIGPLKMLARRTPWLIVAGMAPAAYSAIARGRHELAIVTSFLLHRAEQRGDRGVGRVDLDPERVRRVAVQLLLRRPVGPDVESEDGDLVSSWIRRALRSALPFVRAGVTPHAKSIAAAAARVDVTALGEARTGGG